MWFLLDSFRYKDHGVWYYTICRDSPKKWHAQNVWVRLVKGIYEPYHGCFHEQQDNLLCRKVLVRCQTCKSLKEGNHLSSDFTFLLQGWQVMAKAIMIQMCIKNWVVHSPLVVLKELKHLAILRWPHAYACHFTPSCLLDYHTCKNTISKSLIWMRVLYKEKVLTWPSITWRTKEKSLPVINLVLTGEQKTW